MFSNELNSQYVRRPYESRPNSQPRPQIIEDTLRSLELQIERNALVLTLKENQRGRFLRIIEVRDPRTIASMRFVVVVVRLAFGGFRHHFFRGFARHLFVVTE